MLRLDRSTHRAIRLFALRLCNQSAGATLARLPRRERVPPAEKRGAGTARPGGCQSELPTMSRSSVALRLSPYRARSWVASVAPRPPRLE